MVNGKALNAKILWPNESRDVAQEEWGSGGGGGARERRMESDRTLAVFSTYTRMANGEIYYMNYVYRVLGKMKMKKSKCAERLLERDDARKPKMGDGKKKSQFCLHNDNDAKQSE